MHFISPNILLGKLQKGLPLTIGEQAKLALQLSLPAIAAQLTTILMQYIDAAMVGRLGAEASASIGLVSTSIWLLGGICSSLTAGYAVLVSHRLGAQDQTGARTLFRESLVFTLCFSFLLGLVAALIAPHLPYWLGGETSVCPDAYRYFLVVALSMPLWGINYLFSSMLRSAGNMLVPSVVNIGVCLLDVVFNYLFIFHFHMGVLGAALGTLVSVVMESLALIIYTLGFNDIFRFSHTFRSRLSASPSSLGSALHISLPMAVEHVAMCSAHIVSTIIVAPLGTAAIAANAFGITIEGLCYMPGYGIGDAATTLVGQSIGAKRPELRQSFTRITLVMGMGLMTLMGALMYVGIPYLMPLMTPDGVVQMLTTQVLRIEAFAEPMYAASIIAYAVFVGAGDTKIPCVMNLGSIWLVRLPLAYVLVGYYGLAGFWIAMATELCFRGLIFLLRLRYKR